MASFQNTFSSNEGGEGEEIRVSSDSPFNDVDDAYIGYDPRLPSQRFESNFDANQVEEEVKENPIDSSSIPLPQEDFLNDDDDFTVQHVSNIVLDDDNVIPSTESYGFSSTIVDEPKDEYSSSLFSSVPESNGHEKMYDNGGDIDGVFASDDGPVLPPPTEMEPEEGVVLREWRLQNAIELEEKEKREKEMRNQILDEAEVYKKAFYEKRELNCATNKVHFREKEKLFLANQENFNKNADKQYWKSISELIPNEVASLEKKKGKKDSEKKPSVVVVQGPKPGKPTDLSRMRQILIKLKHETPPHLIPSPPKPAEEKKDGAAAAAGEKPVGAQEGSSKQEVSVSVVDNLGAMPEPVAAS
ncbi:hypothetical protein MKW94_008307 [Papaver nudicaule]|uniref:Clathrin light chain n=1 Tax=Papaver nudicaule TaxID=74823 RepID=A0AA42B4C8_PAPNU|nr:hypothetical protein [Papaver nudicaule]